jgi:hypothetical protein
MNTFDQTKLALLTLVDNIIVVRLTPHPREKPIYPSGSKMGKISRD